MLNIIFVIIPEKNILELSLKITKIIFWMNFGKFQTNKNISEFSLIMIFIQNSNLSLKNRKWIILGIHPTYIEGELKIFFQVNAISRCWKIRCRTDRRRFKWEWIFCRIILWPSTLLKTLIYFLRILSYPRESDWSSSSSCSS